MKPLHIAIAFLAARVLAASYEVNRCFCANDKKIGYTFRYNLTLDDERQFLIRASDFEPRCDAMYGIIAQRCDEGGCLDMPNYAKYKVNQNDDPRTFTRYCKVDHTGTKICYRDAAFVYGSARGNVASRASITKVLDCNQECRKHWSSDESTFSICSYN